MSNLALLPEDIRSEFSIDEQGRAFASRRAIARLCGIDESSIRNIFQNLNAGKAPSKTLETFAGQDFESAGKIPDILVSAIVQHYAFKGRAFNSIYSIKQIATSVIFSSLLSNSKAGISLLLCCELNCLPFR